YALTQQHKHLPEMLKYSGLEKAPVFCPVVAPFYAGMETVIMLHTDQIKGSIKDIKEAYRD
ncbi:MAG: N-acetyl-gamma-glutamyl-phosphate reductase, partial [Lachnospiraceae bacterium]|nr:N-acetyl-gamma-glutamyl-phosphate reductase [Lachnospiraceae bacterium]